MTKLLIILLLIFPLALFSQSFKVNLSPKHQQKLSSIQSGHKQMGKYYKFLKKDSAQLVKSKNKAAKHEWDSLRHAEASARKINSTLAKRGLTIERQIAYADSLQTELRNCKTILADTTATPAMKREARKKIKTLTKDKVNEELAKNGHPNKGELRIADSLKSELTKWWAIMKDTAATDSTRKVARTKVKDLAVAQAMRNPKFQGLYQQYKFGEKPDWETMSKYVPGMDTLQGVFESTPEELFVRAEGLATKAITKAGNLGRFAKQASQFDDYKNQFTQINNPAELKEQGKEQAKEKAIDHFAGHEDKLQGVQEKMSKQLGKYKSFTNSEDLSSAVKRTSLQGKSFKERIVLGGNFNIVSTDPVSVDLSPLAGYKFNTRFYVGVGMNYRQTFSDSLKFNWHVSPSNTSIRVFANYDLIKNFFVYAEAEHAGLKGNLTEEQKKQWRNNYFVGAGKKFLIHPKLFMTVTALYNLNNEDNNPTYPRRFQMRFGFQTSDLAFRKPKVNYEH